MVSAPRGGVLIGWRRNPTIPVAREHPDDSSMGQGANRIRAAWSAAEGEAQAGAVGIAPALESLASALDARVLVLNRAYVAMRIISARRAFIFLAKSLAEVVHVDDGQFANYDFASWTELSQLRREFESEKHDWVRTVRCHIAVPRIIRLLGYDRLPRHEVKLNRRNLFARDRSQCQYCGGRFPTSDLSIDHVIPRSMGGGETWDNLVCACIRCNGRKGGRTPEQARMTLIRPPRMPRRNPMVSIRLGSDRYSSWKAFLDDAYWSVELR
jgi:5-methylcytosine-specific restriction endonuclease McrA